MRKMIFCAALITSAFAQEENPLYKKEGEPEISFYESQQRQALDKKEGEPEISFYESQQRQALESKKGTWPDLYWKFPQGTTMEARLSCFIPQSGLLRNIYDYCGINYELEGTIPVWKPLHVWWAFDYFYKNGKSQGLNQSTRIQIFPITLGLKALFRTPWVQPYVGLGMRYFFVWTHNSSPYVQPSLSKNGMGGVTEIGAIFEPLHHFIIDLFMTYSYKPMHTDYSSSTNISGQSLNVGGWHWGGGLGYQF